jgi:hypothetical protein
VLARKPLCARRSTDAVCSEAARFFGAPSLAKRPVWRLGTQPVGDIGGTAELLARALDGNVGIVGNEAFGASPRTGYDTEASAALLYIDATVDVFEAQQRSGRRVAVNQDLQARELVKAGLARLLTLSDDGREAALRRLWYRLSEVGLRISPRLFEYARDVFELGTLPEVMQNAGYPAVSSGSTQARPL